MRKTTCNVKAIFRLLSNLSNVHRYSTNHLVKEESVLEHTGSVVIFGMAVGLFIKKYLDPNLDLASLALKLTFHDLEESETGDVPRTTKYYNESIRNGLKSFEDEAIEKISGYTEIPDLRKHWSEAKQGEEGVIVSVVDLMCVTYKCYEEIVKFNNFSLKDVGYQSIDHYPTFYKKVDEARDKEVISKDVHEFLTSLLRQSEALGQQIIAKLNKFKT